MFDFSTQPLIQGAYILNSYKEIVDPKIACSPLNPKQLHATLKQVVSKTRSRHISSLISGWSFELKRTVALRMILKNVYDYTRLTLVR